MHLELQQAVFLINGIKKNNFHFILPANDKKVIDISPLHQCNNIFSSFYICNIIKENGIYKVLNDLMLKYHVIDNYKATLMKNASFYLKKLKTSPSVKNSFFEEFASDSLYNITSKLFLDKDNKNNFYLLDSNNDILQIDCSALFNIR